MPPGNEPMRCAHCVLGATYSYLKVIIPQECTAEEYGANFNTVNVQGDIVN